MIRESSKSRDGFDANILPFCISTRQKPAKGMNEASSESEMAMSEGSEGEDD